MKSRTNRCHRYLALAVAAASCAWVTPSYACGASDTYLSTVCVLAWSRNDLRGYLPANGQTLSISQNSALFSLLGLTYGGNGQSTFQLPDLRGRTIIGAGTGIDGISYAVGQAAGNASVTLLPNQMPQHVHGIAAVPLTNVTTTLDLSKATGTAALSGAQFNVDTSQLRVRAANANATIGTPTDAALSVPAGPANRIYSSAAPDVNLAATSLAGSIAVTSTSTAPVTLSGSVNSGVNGTLPATNTAIAGGSQPFSNMQPYLAMYYFIAVQGIFPSSN
ncbi:MULTISPECIES: phage tail protein [unclassified Duganella]|uniref:phage tail protein n=1 Tax=unclassified Duganella TaxID=2636909 RepID=UPI000884C6BC|nr:MULTISPECIES: tail fiber protein [unclassified Duganella]SDG01556.1 Microcystin-dependent protein [Duganella sp. OV458]SDJ03638.1 Microcystin-dependent protein [Duganella sp. OV510]